MTDEEYVFRQTEIERKKLGYGDRCKKRGGGRYVRLPSDHMTKKEREAMNGECFSYEMGKPHTAAELRIWPERVRKEYIGGLIEKYHPTLDMLGEMLNYTRPTVCNYLKRLGLGTGRTGPNRGAEPDVMGWRLFLGSEKAEEVHETVKEEVPEVEDAPVQEELEEQKDQHVIQTSVKSDIHNIAQLLQSLAGTGAKLTIEVTL